MPPPSLTSLCTHALNLPARYPGIFEDPQNASTFLDIVVRRDGKAMLQYYKNIDWFPDEIRRIFPRETVEAFVELFSQEGEEIGRSLDRNAIRRLFDSRLWHEIVDTQEVTNAILQHCPGLYGTLDACMRAPPQTPINSIMFYVRAALRAVTEGPPLETSAYPEILFEGSMSAIYSSPALTTDDRNDYSLLLTLRTRNLALSANERILFFEKNFIAYSLFSDNPFVFDPAYCRQYLSRLIDPEYVLYYLGQAMDARPKDRMHADSVMAFGPRARVEALKRLALRLCRMEHESEHEAFARLDAHPALQALLRRYDDLVFEEVPPLPLNALCEWPLRMALQDFVRSGVQVYG